MNRKKGLARTFQVLIFILGLACLFFTFTRGVWLAGALVLLALLYLYRRSTASLIAIILPIAVILAAGPLANEFAHAGERLRSTEEGADDRLVQAHAGKEMFYARPGFGWGFNNYDHYDRQFLERVGETTPSKWHIKEGTSHHTYLTILAEMGSVGLLLYALPVVWWLALTIRALPRLPREGFWSQRLLITLWLPIGAHILLAQDIDMRFFPYVLTLFWINLGFVANMVQTSLKSNEIQVAGQVV